MQLTLDTTCARKTSDGRVSVIDAIACVTGKSTKYASDVYNRLAAEEQIPKVDSQPLVPRSLIVSGPSGRRTRRGGGRAMLTPVATIAEMTEIICRLPCVTHTPSGGLQFKRKVDEYPSSDDLYIMRYAFRSDCVKIGRSWNPEKRRRQLESGHNFRVEIVDVFQGKGYLEHSVHESIGLHRCAEGSGTEWFNVDVATAVNAVASAMRMENV